MRVAYPSTPAQYFHILRRQARLAQRRPLILMHTLFAIRSATGTIRFVVRYSVASAAPRTYETRVNDYMRSTAPYTVRRSRQQMLRDVRHGLTQNPKRLSPKYFYDERGSELF